MAETSSDYRIRIVTTQDSAGADQAVGDLKRVTGAAEDTVESQDKLGEAGARAAEQLGSLRGAHHVLGGIIDLSRGGAEAVAGIGFEARFAAESLAALIPGYGEIAIAAATLLALGSQLVARQNEHNEKIEQGKKNTGELKGEAQGYKDELDQITKAQEAAEASEKRQLELLKQKQDFAKAALELQKNTAIQSARADYLLGNKTTMSDEELKRRKEQFEATKTDITADSDVATANLALKNKQDDLDQAEKILADRKARIAALQRDKGVTQDKSADAKNFLEKEGIHIEASSGNGGPDDATEKPVAYVDGEKVDVEEELNKRLEKLRWDADNIRKTLPRAGAPDFAPQATAGDRSRLAELEKRIDAGEKYLIEVRLAVAAAPQYGYEKRGIDEQIDKLSAEIQEQHDKIEELTKARDLAKGNVPLAVEKASLDKKEVQQTQAIEHRDQDQTKAETDAAAATKAKIDKLDITAEDKTRPVADRVAAVKAISELTAQQYERRLREGTAPGAAKPLTPGEIDELKAEAEKARADGQVKANTITDEGARKEAATARKEVGDVRRENEELRRQIHAITDNQQILRNVKELDATFANNPAGETAALQAQLAAATAVGFQNVHAVHANNQKTRESIGGIIGHAPPPAPLIIPPSLTPAPQPSAAVPASQEAEFQAGRASQKPTAPVLTPPPDPVDPTSVSPGFQPFYDELSNQGAWVTPAASAPAPVPPEVTASKMASLERENQQLRDQLKKAGAPEINADHDDPQREHDYLQAELARAQAAHKPAPDVPKVDPHAPHIKPVEQPVQPPWPKPPDVAAAVAPIVQKATSIAQDAGHSAEQNAAMAAHVATLAQAHDSLQKKQAKADAAIERLDRAVGSLKNGMNN